MPVRVANPQRIEGDDDVVNNPVYATAVGLLQSGFYDGSKQDAFYGSQYSVKGLWGKVRDWFHVNF